MNRSLFKKTFLFAALVFLFPHPDANTAGRNVIPREMTSLFPVGRVFTGVKIPSYEDDKLQSVLEADTITRINRTFLKLTDLVVKIYNAQGNLESTIRMKEARYHLLTRELESTTPARVEHEKFVMTGDKMTFDTVREVSTMKGNVRVVIPNAKEFTGNLNNMWGD